ncbi:hypothetical protein QPK31_03880 [Massilia sp. YIM B02769]|uniref:hypothetical protein n=1 Tax=unclassified Massilia TaxID=2609279 RepID=UPI0025B6EFD9|nr:MULTISPECIES: hypothetical protein [unclassified Massilia]MDN4057362.1 hypothetical protein [Massilia sp. YIM B02769]
MKISYSFKLPTAAQPVAPRPAEQSFEYAYNEFYLQLPADWRQIPTPQENTFHYYSEALKAAIIVSIDFYSIPDEKLAMVGERCLGSRQEAIEQLAPGQVALLHRSIKPHSGGSGLELHMGAEVPGKNIHLYLGYVTSRKIFNLTIVCEPDRPAAEALFNAVLANLGVKLP